MSELIRDCYRPGSGGRWIRWAAWASVLAPAPSGAWRLALAAGAPLGFSAERPRGIGVPGWASLYAAGLSVVSVALACLALGLIRPWGEVFPQKWGSSKLAGIVLQCDYCAWPRWPAERVGPAGTRWGVGRAWRGDQDARGF